MAHQHPYHLVDQSPWPLTGAFSGLMMTSGNVLWFHTQKTNLTLVGFLLLITNMVNWWRDIIRKANFQGSHTAIVNKGMRYGMILFITSEVCFFFAFFWAFFHSSLAPSVEIGVAWPPSGITPLNPFLVPLLNTGVLLSSGVTLSWSHHSILAGNRTESIQALFLTVALGSYFTALQAWEYIDAPFTIADSVYGSTFFVATGFHGLQVIIGTTFLMVCLFRTAGRHFSTHHHFGFEAAAWYWHFVDVVWFVLYWLIYWWGA
ncbi:cytochrome c oxidase subunit III (mitochondrion) [Strongylocentrotus purpuratus]|uniref:Cytochrome c oxidase subunit 3 n=1 Tax=Strongylocentrotus purpuratus TaxID=7668 RepID=A0A7M6UGX6_STRPU|nr:cytochrome c oxidase subunit III [Strongylocentrotus purpuratus]|eukprot:NP_006972.1 cytochrome c oxidase subunit III (mitochondrion) [Strongylocentrotus purpuratus]